MLRPEPLDVLIIVLAAMLLFGANRLPEIARAMGKALREFRDALTDKDETNSNQTSTPNSDSSPRHS